MGKIDTITKAYVRQPEVFADICNYALFDGNQVIKSDYLTERDPNELNVIFKTTDNKDIIIPTQRIRDILKSVVIMNDSNTTYMIVGIENQTHTHYAMPVRNMLYDALNYSAQTSLLAGNNRRDNASGEFDFLSGLKSTDKLAPVITITLYWGTESWDAPRSLFDMIDVKPDVRKYISDYKLNLIVPSEIKDFDKFQTDIGCVLNLISASGDEFKTSNIFKTDERFQHIDKSAVILINELLNTNYKIIENKGGSVNMCKAWNDAMEHSKEVGRSEGRSEGLLEAFVENVETLSRNMNITIEQAVANLGKTMTDYEKAKEKVAGL